MLLIESNLIDIVDEIGDYSDAINLVQLDRSEERDFFTEVTMLIELKESCQCLRENLLYIGNKKSSKDKNIVGYYLSAVAKAINVDELNKVTPEQLVELKSELLDVRELLKRVLNSSYSNVDMIVDSMSEEIHNEAEMKSDTTVYNYYFENYNRFY